MSDSTTGGIDGNVAGVSALKTPSEWAAERGVEILDPDGWRGRDAKSFDEPITAEEFDRRLVECTGTLVFESPVAAVPALPATARTATAAELDAGRLGWWFATHCDESAGGLPDHPWRPMLQLDDTALFLDGVWFATEQDCIDFVRDNVIPRAGVTHA